MQLYYSPTSCGKAAFIAAAIAGVTIETERRVDIHARETASGADFFAINPTKGTGCLFLNDGTRLDEGSAVLQAIADMKPGTLAPENGTKDRYLVQNILQYTASEVHAPFGQLYNNPTLAVPVREYITRYHTALKHIEEEIVKGKKFVVGDKFSIADSYLAVVLSWCPCIDIDTAAYPEINRYVQGVFAHEPVAAACAKMDTQPHHLGYMSAESAVLYYSSWSRQRKM